MNDEQQHIIDDYAREVERHLVGSVQEKARRTAELVEHLSDAAEEGELTEAIERLGPPETAAATFAKHAFLTEAPIDKRLMAILIDNLPLIGVSVALAVQAISRGRDISIAFPPWVYQSDGGVLHALGVPLALVWSIIILGIMEGLRGVTPGKAAMGLRVVTEAGLKISVGDGIGRRLSLLTGPIAWLDVAPFSSTSDAASLTM